MPMHLQTKDNDEETHAKAKKEILIAGCGRVMAQFERKKLNHVIGGEIKDDVHRADELRD